MPVKAHAFSKLLASRVMVIDTHHDRGTPNLDTAWFLVSLREIPMSEGRSSFYRMIFEDALTLFDNRIIPFKADFPEGSEDRTRINTIATRALEKVYDVTLGTLAGPDRVLEPAVTNKAAVSAVAPVISKEIPWKRSLTVLKQIAKSSRDLGAPVYFDLITRNTGGSLKFTFTTYSEQRGADKSQQIITSQDPLFVLSEFSYNFKVNNVAYVGGSGRGLNRLVGIRTHPNTKNIERVEVFRSAQSSDQDLLEDEAAHLINNTANKISLSGQLLGTLGDKFNFGDRVTLEHRSLIVPCEISSIRFVLNDQHLQREIYARSID